MNRRLAACIPPLLALLALLLFGTAYASTGATAVATLSQPATIVPLESVPTASPGPAIISRTITRPEEDDYPPLWWLNRPPQEPVRGVVDYSSGGATAVAPLARPVLANAPTGAGSHIHGRVVAAANGLPLADIHVAASDYDTESTWYDTQTDASGYYTFTNLADNDYRIRVDDWTNNGGWAQQYYDHHFAHHLADRVTISGSSQPDNINFSLEPGGYITGFVYDQATGLPLANINVQTDLLAGEGGTGTCTQADGSFTLGGLTVGSYVVYAARGWNYCLNAPGVYAQEYFEETPYRHLATTVPVNSAIPVPNVNFTLEPGATILGRVTDAATGQPLGNVQVNVNLYDPPQDHVTSARTDASGYYTATGLVAIDYRVGVDDPNWIPDGYAMQYYNQVIAWEAATRVQPPTAGIISDIDFPLQPAGAITGFVWDESGAPLANVNVGISLVDGSWGRSFCTDENGYYEMRVLPYGRYKASAGGNWNHCTQQTGVYVEQYFDHVANWDAATVLTLDAATPLLTNVNYNLQLGGFITGHVADADDVPVADLHVQALWPDNQWAAATNTDANGDYTLGPLAAGDYLVRACPSCSGQLLVDEYFDDVYHAQDATAVAVTTGAITPNVNFSLDTGVLLTGHVNVPPGYSAANLQVDVWQTIPWGYGSGRQTDANGDYAIPIPPIYDTGWAVAIRPWGTDLAAQWAHDFYLTDQTAWDFDLTLGSTITGCVSDGGAPVAGLWVNADAWQINQGDETGPDGCYAITNLPAADYVVRVEGWNSARMDSYYGGYDWNWAQRLHLRAGETIGGIDIVAPLAGRMEGHIYETDGVTGIEGVHVTAVATDGGGLWHGWSQPDGYYTLDAPVGDYKLYFQSDDFWQTVARYYPNAATYAAATVVTAPPLPAAATINMTLPRFASLSGQVTDALSGDPLPGIYVTAQPIDPALNRELTTDGSCTDDNGQYTIGHVFPGLTRVTAVGTCGNVGYGMVSSDYTAVAGQHATVNLAATQNAPARPFTIRLDGVYDYTPLSSGNGVQVTDADQVLAALFTPLAQLDETGHWYSDLLTQLPLGSNGGAAIINEQLVVTYTLKSGLLWSDGAPLTSADIRFAWQMLTQPYPGYDEGLLSFELYHLIERVETPDALTAVVYFLPRNYPPGYLGAITYPMPEHILSGQHPHDIRWSSHYAHYPVGNGPYVVVDWLPGSHLTLHANPNYHKRSQGYPLIEDVRFLFTAHPFWSLVDGSAQVSLNVADKPGDFETFGLAIYANATHAFDSIMPNVERPYFAETAVRQALYHALNRAQFVAGQWPDRIVADTWLPPSHHMATGNITTYDYDLTAAANLLTSAGWVDSNGNGVRDKNGVELVFTVAYPEGQSQRQELLAMFQADLATIGVDANVVAMPWGDLLEQARRGRLDAWTLGWYFDNRYDPAITWLLHSDSIPTAYTNHQGSNFSHWANAANDAILDVARTELDDAALRTLYAQEVALFSQEVPFWVTSHWLRYDLTAPTLLNFQPSAHAPATWNLEQWSLPANPYDLSVRKALAADSPPPQPGNSLIYALTVQNQGALDVDGALLIDTLPPEVTFVAANPAPTSTAGGVLQWNLGSVPAGSPAQTFRVTVQIPAATPHGTPLTNVAQVYSTQSDSRPGNNGFVHHLTVRDDVDLAVAKSGVGQPAVGEHYDYYLDYANWGGAPVADATITDTLPLEVTFLSADPPPDSVNGRLLTWNVGSLVGNQWGGQIAITAEIINVGDVVNTAVIHYNGPDVNPANNSDDHSEDVAAILPPLITQPTQGTTDATPTIKGLAPSSALVELWDLSAQPPVFVLATTASVTGTFSLTPTFAPGSYTLAATATKAGLTSGYSNTAAITVAAALELDPDFVRISAGGVNVSAGVVRAERRTLAHRMLDITAVLPCITPPTANLAVTENGLFAYDLLPVTLTSAGSNLWRVEFRLWLADPHSTYDIWLEWTCNGMFHRESLLYILIDPDGYVYDQTLVDGGSPITNSLLLDAVVTAYVKVDNDWQVWPAHVYGQINPQTTDATTADGVLEPGYYSFLTPPGQYRIAVAAPGYRPYQSQVLTVINEPIHLDVGLLPVAGGGGQALAPADLAASALTVDRAEAWVGETLTYDLWLENGSVGATGELTATAVIPDHTHYVPGSLCFTGEGAAGYDAGTQRVWWTGALAGESAVHLMYQVVVDSTPGDPFDVVTEVAVAGSAADLFTLPELQAVTAVPNVVGLTLGSAAPQSGPAGTVITYYHTLQNTGNAPDTFGVTAVSDHGWAVTHTPNPTLATGATTTIAVVVVIPPNLSGQTVDTTTLTVYSLTSPGRQQTVTDVTTAYRRGFGVYLPIVVKSP